MLNKYSSIAYMGQSGNLQRAHFGQSATATPRLRLRAYTIVFLSAPLMNRRLKYMSVMREGKRFGKLYDTSFILCLNIVVRL